MKRYFEQVGKHVTICLDLKPPASLARVEDISKMTKMELRELTKKEYDKLTEEYSKPNLKVILKDCLAPEI
jgi:hypothetical protein